jgi:hypothetical protein
LPFKTKTHDQETPKFQFTKQSKIPFRNDIVCPFEVSVCLKIGCKAQKDSRMKKAKSEPLSAYFETFLKPALI